MRGIHYLVITNFNSVAGFKRSITKVDFTTFLKGDFMLS